MAIFKKARRLSRIVPFSTSQARAALGISKKKRGSAHSSFGATEDYYSRMEGLIVNIGVIQALVAGFVVGMQMTVLPRSSFNADLFSLLCSSQAFREFTVHILKDYKHPDHGLFNFTREVGDNEVLDIRQWMLVEASQHKGLQLDYGGSQAANTFRDCNKVPQMAASFEAILPNFPPDRMLSWLAYHREEAHLVSDAIHLRISLASGFNFGGLLVSIILYISLTLSPSGEDQSGMALKAWSKYALWLAIGDIVLLGIALTFMCLGLSQTVLTSSTNWGLYYKYYHFVAFFCIILPLVIIAFAVGGTAFFCAKRAKAEAEAAAAVATE